MIAFGDQSGALVPDLLFGFGLHAELAGIHIGDRAPHAVVGLATIESLLYTVPKIGIIDKVEDVNGPADVIQLPECLPGLVLPGVRSQLTHDCGLRHILLCEGCQNALNVRPLLENPTDAKANNRLLQRAFNPMANSWPLIHPFLLALAPFRRTSENRNEADL